MECVACNKELPATAKFCRYCGANQSQAPAPIQSQTPPPPPPQPQVVPQPIEAQPATPVTQPVAKQSTEAVPPASVAAPSPNAASQKQPKSSATLAIAIVAVLVVGAGGAWFWNSKQQSDAKIAELQKKADEEAKARQNAEADAAKAKNASSQVSTTDNTPTAELLQPTPLIKPSFDCAKAATAVEKMICDSPKISMLDGLLAHAYQSAQAGESNPSQKEQSRTQQIEWLKTIRNTCKDSTCLETAYTERIAAMGVDIETLNKYLVSAGWSEKQYEKQYKEGVRFCAYEYQKSNLTLFLIVYCAGDALKEISIRTAAANSPPAAEPPKQSQTLSYSHGTYVGEVANGKANGQGKYTSNKTGTTYTGSFVDDKFNGSGTMAWADGSKYVGTWQSDIGVQGAMTLPDGRVVKGTVKNAKFTESK
jgi:hypothetical protein